MSIVQSGKDYAVYCGDCLEIVPELQRRFTTIDALVSDPPYGMNHDTKYTRFTKGESKPRDYKPVFGDNTAFDPSPWLDFPSVVLFGSNHFGSRLPVGTTLVWYKRRANKTGKFLSDCEVAWQKGGKGVYLFHHIWDGFDRASERGQKTLHPTQKPVAVMRWILERLKLPKGATVLDPYCGSGSTGVAALQLGYKFIGIDREIDYVTIAASRLADAEMREEAA